MKLSRTARSPRAAKQLLGLGLTALVTLSGPANAAPTPRVWLTYLLLHQVGSETATFDGDDAHGGALHVEWSLNDRGMKRAGRSVLTYGPGFQPAGLTSWREGQTAPVASVTIAGVEVKAEEFGTTRTFEAPPTSFPGQTAMTASLEAALFSYWRDHGRPSEIPMLRAEADAPPAEIRSVGEDQIVLQRRRVTLHRYTIANLVFGREIVWSDDRGDLVAVMRFAAGLPQEQVLQDYAPAFDQLVRSGVRQELEDLAELGRRVRPEASGAFAIRGARLIDGRGGPAVENATVVVRDGRIAAIGGADLELPRALRIVDARGLTLIPGLWDMHVHYSGVEFGPALLAAGITTARDCGGEFGFITAVRSDIEHGGLGPKLLLAGLVDSGGPLAFGAVDVETPAEGAAAVDRYADAGFNQIKVYTQLKPEVLNAVAAEAHRRGLSVTGHVPAAVDAFGGVADGMDQINHLQFVANAMREPGAEGPPDLRSDRARRLIQLLAEHRIVVDPTDGWGEMASHPRSVPPGTFEPGLGYAPFTLRTKYVAIGGDGDEARWRERLAANGRLILALHAAGVPLVAGVDTGLPGFGLDRELELYVAAGLSPAAALETATLGAARAVGLEAESGSIEVGKRADLVLLRGDPLTNISAVRHVVKVVAAGRLYDGDALGRSVGFAGGR